MSLESKKGYIIEELRKNGCRITNQRQLLIDIILQDECSSCKEIYYQASKVDSSIGMATVYRLVKTLEEAGLIQRKNMYRIDYEALAAGA
jgi:Fe2+/Zn2+ uptake regulation proteins